MDCPSWGSVFLKRYSNRLVCLQLSTISFKWVIRTWIRWSVYLWSDSKIFSRVGYCHKIRLLWCAIFQHSFVVLLCLNPRLASLTAAQLQWGPVLRPALSDWAEFHYEETSELTELPNAHEVKLPEGKQLIWLIAWVCRYVATRRVQVISFIQ